LLIDTDIWFNQGGTRLQECGAKKYEEFRGSFIYFCEILNKYNGEILIFGKLGTWTPQLYVVPYLGSLLMGNSNQCMATLVEKGLPCERNVLVSLSVYVAE
jgi:hypothetical protein